MRFSRIFCRTCLDETVALTDALSQAITVHGVVLIAYIRVKRRTILRRDTKFSVSVSAEKSCFVGRVGYGKTAPSPNSAAISPSRRSLVQIEIVLSKRAEAIR